MNRNITDKILSKYESLNQRNLYIWNVSFSDSDYDYEQIMIGATSISNARKHCQTIKNGDYLNESDVRMSSQIKHDVMNDEPLYTISLKEDHIFGFTHDA